MVQATLPFIDNALSKTDSFRTTEDARELHWSPDGSAIAYTTHSNKLRIRFLHDGSDAVVSPLISVTQIGWSPRGRYLAFIDGTHLKIATSSKASGRVTDSFSADSFDWVTDTRLLIVLHGVVRILDFVAGRWRDPKSLGIGEYDVTSILVDRRLNKLLLLFQRKVEVWALDGDSAVRESKIALSRFRTDISSRGTRYIAELCITKPLLAVVTPELPSAVRLYDYLTGKEVLNLQSHDREIKRINFSQDGSTLMTVSLDATAKLWSTTTWKNVGAFRLPVTFSDATLGGANCKLALLDDSGRAASIYSVNLQSAPTQEQDDVSYMTARVVMLGDSGVGKTALGWRICAGSFQEHESTHGRQFWIAPALGKVLADGTECDAIIWDLAGQPDYRLTHTMFLQNIDIAVLVFDASNRQQPLSGIEYWLRHLSRQEPAPKFILVGARSDRGTPTLSTSALDGFCISNGIVGGYISTSAVVGTGIDDLIDRLGSLLDWDKKLRTITNQQFNQLKHRVLETKREANDPLVSLADFISKSALRNDVVPSVANALPHLESHGYLGIIEDVRGSQWVLTQPALLDNLAASIVLEARRQPEGLGSLDEARLLDGDYHFDELLPLSAQQRQILLEASLSRFFKSAVCYRETLGNRTLIIFPSLISEQPPEHMFPSGLEDAVSLIITGATERVYPSLAVLLGYTNLFARHMQWRDQAQYTFETGEVCGFKQISQDDGSIILTLRYGPRTAHSTKSVFEGIVDRLLARQDVDVIKCPTVQCAKCNAKQPREVVLNLMSARKLYGFCSDCGHKYDIASDVPRGTASELERSIATKVEAGTDKALQRSVFEESLTRLKAYLAETAPSSKPSCFVAYPWESEDLDVWVTQLAQDLKHANIEVALDHWHSGPGESIVEFTQRIQSSDIVVVVCTPQTKAKYETRDADPVLKSELEIIAHKVSSPSRFGRTVIPVLRRGSKAQSFIPILEPLVHVDFTIDSTYFVRAIELIWSIHRLPRDNPLLKQILRSLSDSGN